MSFLGIKNPFRTGSGAVKREAAAAAAARQGRASNLTRQIEGVFSDPRRQQRITDFMGAFRSQLGDATNRGYADVSRRAKFATAGSGLTGGSVDLSRQQRNTEELFRRRGADEAQVQDAGAGLRQQDDATKQSLLNSAYGTADVGQDAWRSMLGSRANLSGYMATLLPQAVQGAGSAWAGAYGRGQEANDRNRGYNYWTGG